MWFCAWIRGFLHVEVVRNRIVVLLHGDLEIREAVLLFRIFQHIRFESIEIFQEHLQGVRREFLIRRRGERELRVLLVVFEESSEFRRHRVLMRFEVRVEVFETQLNVENSIDRRMVDHDR